MQALYPHVTVFSCNESARIIAMMNKHIVTNPGAGIEWSRYPGHVMHVHQEDVATTLERLLQRTLSQTCMTVYIVFFFEGNNHVVKTDLQVFLRNFFMVYQEHATMIIWNPTEGYAIESTGLYTLSIGCVGITEVQPAEDLFRKCTSTWSFMRHKGSLHELFKVHGLEVFGDDEAGAILATFQQSLSFTKWRTIDWEKIKQKRFVGRDEKMLLPALKQLINRPFDDRVYLCRNKSDVPLMRIALTPETVSYQPIWSRANGTFLFNLSERYVIEVDLQGTITVGLVNSTN